MSGALLLLASGDPLQVLHLSHINPVVLLGQDSFLTLTLLLTLGVVGGIKTLNLTQTQGVKIER